MHEFKELQEEEKRYLTKSCGKLQKSVPVFIRVKFRAFETFNKRLLKPFDPLVEYAMEKTMIKLCQEIQGSIFGFVARDEITVVVVDYNKATSTAWLDYDIESVSSAAASIAAVAFTKYMEEHVNMVKDKGVDISKYQSCLQQYVSFTTKCFNVPDDRICDMLLLKQLLNRRNSIQIFGHQYLSRNRQLGMCNEDIIDTVNEEFGEDWNMLSNTYKLGCGCTKGPNPFTTRRKWRIVKDLPLLRDENKWHIESIINSINK